MSRKFTHRTVEEKQRIVGEIDRLRGEGLSLYKACKEAQIAMSQYHAWKNKHSGHPNGDAREIKHRSNGDKAMKIENQRLRMIVADQCLDIQALKEYVAR